LEELQRKALYSLVKSKMLHKYVKDVIQVNVQNLKYKIIKEWIELAEERRVMRP
jgi:hypothetical protein